MQYIELQYFPVISSIKTLSQDTHIVIPLYDRFRKMTFQNRTIIPSANGLTTLSIPLRGGRENKQALGEVRIDNSQHWQVRHWRTITAAYRRSPWFEFYEPGLSPFFETRYELLYEWNLELLKWVLANLKFEAVIGLQFERPEEEPGKKDAPAIKPSNFQDDLFCSSLSAYAQVFQDRIGFQANMSIIDLIFNQGNKSPSIVL